MVTHISMYCRYRSIVPKGVTQKGELQPSPDMHSQRLQHMLRIRVENDPSGIGIEVGLWDVSGGAVRQHGCMTVNLRNKAVQVQNS